MDKNTFINKFKAMTGITDDQKAEQATEDVLDLFSHRMMHDESEDAKAQLPQGVKELWEGQNWAGNLIDRLHHQKFSYETQAEFFSKLEEKFKDHDIQADPKQVTQVIVQLLKEQISEGESQDIMSQLPKEISLLWQNS